MEKELGDAGMGAEEVRVREENEGVELQPATELNEELVKRTSNLENYIEKESARNLDFMKFEAVERLRSHLSQYHSMVATAERLEDAYKNDAEIHALTAEVDWFQQRVAHFQAIYDSDLQALNQYKQTVANCKIENKKLEQQLKNSKGEVIKLQHISPSSVVTSPSKGTSKPPFFPVVKNLPMHEVEKEQIQYLQQSARKVKQTLKQVKNEIQKYKAQEFFDRQQVLPVEEFFTECYKSVYHLIFQRQGQLDDEQLTIAYQVFREQKIELLNVKHRDNRAGSRNEKNVMIDALQGKFQSVI
jgi:hypothetical protein